MTDARKAREPESEPKTKKPANLREIFNRAAASLFDTEVLFAVGDFLYACLTAERFGIAINGVAAAIAVGGRLYESLTGSKPMGLGFYSMAAVSAVSAGSVLVNAHQKFLTGMFNLMSAGPRELLFSAAANAFWTAANGLAGYWKSKGTEPKNPLANHQMFFCLGSICATNAKFAPLVFFLAGLVKAMSKKHPDSTKKMETWRDFGAEHATPQRFRGAAYFISTISAAFDNPRYALPYLMWMLGNLAFDNNGKNKTLKSDLKAVMGPARKCTDTVRLRMPSLQFAH